MTDEMLAILDRAAGREHSRDGKVVAALREILAIVERQHQQELHDAFQRGWQRGQHRLCPRCGVELEREVAAERDGTP